ncbi:hypothetical protein [Pseudovibrio exalbescens]|uniref:hypothetical protein n=1 Tax=Pseudovibrio exalbescens TaxID=197461 RepID=UPI000C99DD42|nr:hypothetical protein [Pseudovibrio exalbescens]
MGDVVNIADYLEVASDEIESYLTQRSPDGTYVQCMASKLANLIRADVATVLEKTSYVDPIRVDMICDLTRHGDAILTADKQTIRALIQQCR